MKEVYFKGDEPAMTQDEILNQLKFDMELRGLSLHTQILPDFIADIRRFGIAIIRSLLK